jgi:hypothetical protein
MRRTAQSTGRVHGESQKEGRECFQKNAKQSCLNLGGKVLGAIKWKGWRQAVTLKTRTTYVHGEVRTGRVAKEANQITRGRLEMDWARREGEAAEDRLVR